MSAARTFVFLVFLVLFVGCKDEGVERLRAVKVEYVELVEKGVSPRDPRFDKILAQLSTVPPDSDAAQEAAQMKSAIEKARALPPRPLASPSGAPGTEAIAARCESIARALGTAREDQRNELIDALAKCRQELERHRAHAHPPGSEPH
ncbi:MAG: hypothetical protein WBV82_17825 [Myxococcaceae bacterium]